MWLLVPLLCFGKNFFADVRAGDGMIGEIIIEKKGTIVFFFYPIGDCARPSKRLSEDWRHLSLLPGNRGSIWFLKISVKSQQKINLKCFSADAPWVLSPPSVEEKRSEEASEAILKQFLEDVKKKLDLNWIWTQPKLIWPHRQIWPNQTSRCGGWKYVRKRL